MNQVPTGSEENPKQISNQASSVSQTSTPPMQNNQTSPSFSTQFPVESSNTQTVSKKVVDTDNATEQTVVHAPPSEVKDPPSEAKIITQKTQAGTDSIYAPISKRYFAVLVDGIIISLVSLLFNFPYFFSLLKNISESSSLAGLGTLSEQQAFVTQETNVVFTVLSFIGWLVGVLYPLYFIGQSGATPGKALFKIKVVDEETNEAPGFLKAFLREFVGKFISSLVLGLGYITAFKDEHKQAWHDKIAGTIVIRV